MSAFRNWIYKFQNYIGTRNVRLSILSKEKRYKYGYKYNEIDNGHDCDVSPIKNLSRILNFSFSPLFFSSSHRHRVCKHADERNM